MRHFNAWKSLKAAPNPAVVVLLAVSLGALGLPFLFGVSHAVDSLLGPPAIWNRPRMTPAAAALAGTYTESSRTLDRTFDGPKASLNLHADGTMRVRNLPYEQMDQRHCRISGDGYWSGASEQGHLNLHVNDTDGADACAVGAYSFLAIAGKGEPYSLYWTVSDPDADTGVWLASNR